MENHAQMLIALQYLGRIDNLQTFHVLYTNQLIHQLYLQHFVELSPLFFHSVPPNLFNLGDLSSEATYF